MTAYIPTEGNMIVEEIPSVSKAGLVLPDNQKDYADDQLFEVKALPVDYEDEDIKVGDKVVIVGMLNHFVHAGKKITLAKIKEVVMVVR